MFDNYELVYSTTAKSDKKSTQKSSQSKRLGIRLEKKGRAGKAVTIIENLHLSDDELKKMCKEIKNKCGTGGTVKLHHIEIQGDFREKIHSFLKEKGFKL